MKNLLITSLIIFVLVGLTGCDDFGKSQLCVYKVSGSNGCRIASSITIIANDGVMQQYTNVNLPWEYRDDRCSRGKIVSITAQSGSKKGCIVSEIYRRADRFKHSKSCGSYVIASAAGVF